MKNSDMPAMPIFDDEAKLCIVRNPETGETSLASGLTKREHFAAMAMQGLLANSGGAIQSNSRSGFGWCNTDANGMAELAIECADALLEELSK